MALSPAPRESEHKFRPAKGHISFNNYYKSIDALYGFQIPRQNFVQFMVHFSFVQIAEIPGRPGNGRSSHR